MSCPSIITENREFFFHYYNLNTLDMLFRKFEKLTVFYVLATRQYT